MFHQHKTSLKDKFLKNPLSRVYSRCVSFWMLLRFHRFQRHHKIAILAGGLALFFISIVGITMIFSSHSVLAQIRFQLAIRPLPRCQNGVDDDGDTLIDFPSDPDCVNPSDTSEGVPSVPPTVVCFAPTTQGNTSQSITWIAIPSNGNGTYTYSWSGSDSLTGTTTSVNHIYTSAGTKSASLIVTSGGISSASTPCVNTITITAPAPPSGGSGGGGGGGGITTVPTKPPVVPDQEDDITPPLDAAPPGGDEETEDNETISHKDCPVPTLQSTFRDYKDYLVCDNLITERVAEEQYEYGKHTPRKELLGVAVELALKDKSLSIREGLDRLSSANEPVYRAEVSSSRPFHFFDVGLEGQPLWIVQTVQKGVILGLVSTENTLFRPDDNVTRAEAFGMLMKATCMNPDESIYPTWEERIYATAKRYNLTTRNWKTFEPSSAVLRQELFVITSKIDLWRDYTGGCTPKSVLKPLPPILQTVPVVMPPLSSAPPIYSSPTNPLILNTDTPSISSDQGIQKPGTFALLYENETEKVYSYIVKSGGIPDGVRAQFIRVFGFNTSIASRLKIHDIAGTEFAEDRWLLGGELIYVTLQK